jgi:alkanesulfonate monooxygenase SsuD/methylene tetrahydromethanopterin reductase-like flavin-dependent oxidoreductase (luciferase family)
VLYQAGASTRGRQFAAENAECVFVAAPSKTILKKYVADIRQRAAAAGRDPKKILVYTLLTVVVDATDAKAQAKIDEYNRYASQAGALTLVSGWSGVDFAQFKPEQHIKYIQTNAIQSTLEALSSGDPDRVWTVSEIAKWSSIGGLGPVIVGSPSTVADTLEEWVAETDVDGFNLAYSVAHETFSDVVEFLVPELQRRGVYASEYQPGTLRQKLFGTGDHLPPEHPGSQWRDLARHEAKPNTGHQLEIA